MAIPVAAPQRPAQVHAPHHASENREGQVDEVSNRDRCNTRLGCTNELLASLRTPPSNQHFDGHDQAPSCLEWRQPRVHLRTYCAAARFLKGRATPVVRWPTPYLTAPQ